MTHGTPDSTDAAGSHDAGRLEPLARLSSADEAAVDAVLGAGFDPDRPTDDARQAAVTRLLGALDHLPDADGPRLGDTAVVDATLARIERFDDERRDEEADASRGTDSMPFDPVLPWHRNLLGAAAAVLLLAGLAIWTNGGVPGGTPSTATRAGILEIPDWGVSEAQTYVASDDERGPGAVPGELWLMRPDGGRHQIVFVPQIAQSAAAPILRANNARSLGTCLFSPPLR